MTVEKEVPYEKWVSALRSGEYSQVKGTLKGELPEGGTGYCCLGVLADVLGWEMEREPLTEEYNDYKNEGDDLIYEDIREIIGSEVADSLITYNDSYKKDFPWIADYIEKEFIANDDP